MLSKIILFVCLFVCFSSSARSTPIKSDNDGSGSGSGARNGEGRLKMRVISHQSCTRSPGSNEKIRFPNSERAPLVADAVKGEGCYVINGNVNVLQTITGAVQIYAETRYGMDSEPADCENADPKGCGGVGSCVYCDACSNIKNIHEKTKGLVQLETGDGKSLDCENGLKAGNYSNVRISFCMPTKNDFLKHENLDESIWNEYAKKGRLFSAVLYVFNDKVNELDKAELRKLATPGGKGVIGCHRLIGSVYEKA